MPRHHPDLVFERHAAALGLAFDAPIRAVPRYEVAVEHGGQLFVSGQIPRVGDAVAVTGAAGAQASLADAERAARICAVRALAVMRQHLGSLMRVRQVLRMTVYVHSAPGFTQHSEVADAASEILYEVFAPVGGHARTSVGVAQLPKNATVELELVAAVSPLDESYA